MNTSTTKQATHDREKVTFRERSNQVGPGSEVNGDGRRGGQRTIGGAPEGGRARARVKLHGASKS